MWWNISHFLFLCGAYNEFSETDCCDLELRISFFPLGFDRLRKFLLVMSAGTQHLIATPDRSLACRNLCLFLHFSSPLPLFVFSFRESLLSCDLRFGHTRDSRRGDSGRERRDFFLSLDCRRRLRQQCRSRRGKGTPWRTPRPCMGVRDPVRCLFTWAQCGRLSNFLLNGKCISLPQIQSLL
ncbi:hypothetical protein TGGT1_462973 [Toxoplasma gondii GT1]|uniref:Transmembrane protein n=1 Tax=Toxoplasma gondii (strain ATCC 50853 / GT1) TaxID=507601 RepID=S7W9Z3_TOXGG|nr:hypothetical protein TGGT1_462973 [Toxoplasma gondii GT1]